MHPVLPARRRLRRALLLGLLLALPGALLPVGLPLLAAPAQAQAAPDAAMPPGTLVFVKDHDVWIARGDGSAARRVTTGGAAGNPWRSPTQSGTGVIVATRGPLLYRMDQWGNVLDVIDPPALVNTAGQPMDGTIAEAAISPDGSRIAYTYTQYTCPVGVGCAWRSVTGYTDATTTSPPAKYGTTPFEHPSWVTGGRTLVTGGYLSQLNLHDLGHGEAVHWFDDSELYANDTDLGNGEVSPDGRLLAAVRGYGDSQQIIWYAVNGDARTGRPTLPTPLCWTETGAGITNPTWAPDGSALAIEQPQGIEIARDIQGCTSITLAIPGGSQPSWSRAALSTQRPAAKRITATARPKVSGKARAGRRLTVSTGRWTPAPATYAYQWYRDNRPVPGARSRTYRVAKADRGRRLSVRVTASRPGYASASATTAPLKVRR
ncbi:hypothetical protein [Pimelobacter simplex]|uniref:hypothetical protein n=1 Tax=Nocardioides simplex TaxID=2045 RepID=UPI003AAEC744